MKKYIMLVLVVGLLAYGAGVLFPINFNVSVNDGETNFGGGINYTKTVTLLNAVSASSTSPAINIADARNVTLSFTVSGLSSSGVATSTFVVTASVDGTNYVTYSKLIDNVTNTNVQDLTRVASEIIDSNKTSILTMDLEHDTFKYFKVTDTITPISTSTVSVTALINY